MKPIGKQRQLPLMAIAKMIATHYDYQVISEFKYLKGNENTVNTVLKLMNEYAQAKNHFLLQRFF